MKKTALKSIFALFTVVVLFFVCTVNTFAETISDRLENSLNDLVDRYQNADSEEQKSIEERFNEFITKYGLDQVDLSSITESDIGQIVAGIGDSSSLDDIKKLAEDAFSSGLAMIQDALGGGLGTADGSNTAKEPATSPNVIVAGTAPATPNQIAVGVPENNIPPVTQEPTTYDVGNQVENNMVGAAVKPSEPVSVTIENSGMGTSSVIVLVVLAVATLAVIAAIVVFFVKKRK